jgi:hypothetical protein
MATKSTKRRKKGTTAFVLLCAFCGLSALANSSQRNTNLEPRNADFIPDCAGKKRLRGREAPTLKIFLSLIFLSSLPLDPDAFDRKILDRKISKTRAAPGF